MSKSKSIFEKDVRIPPKNFSECAQCKKKLPKDVNKRSWFYTHADGPFCTPECFEDFRDATATPPMVGRRLVQ